ncbi:unnamed protein product [Prunus armeniaca]|uniref:Secreted protein n=1 Tax=Prunus armeniaca TaxID=36596 RepID=A0A6J5XB56_PRUAR|nr:unnamed protein product [Prunus armeniaca]
MRWSFHARCWGFMPLFWAYMPHFRFTPPDLPNSNPFSVVPWLSSDRFLPSSSRCIGVYDFSRDGDSRADCYSDIDPAKREIANIVEFV